ncbi:hypothetical protein BDA99DRAFT_543079 [Phascolomyces articulosus]|uniref:Uncharacterized protein n=1 Tax=Phascolomyces articulosus TaxID=60185 RepID=A0AAD5JNT4_9FUNG|nr:hypothetical protein BDA99DRAFT_543079 [Phascolomyces articulosus]
MSVSTGCVAGVWLPSRISLLAGVGSSCKCKIVVQVKMILIKWDIIFGNWIFDLVVRLDIYLERRLISNTHDGADSTTYDDTVSSADTALKNHKEKQKKNNTQLGFNNP